MEAGFRWFWQYIRQHQWLTLGIIVVLIAFILSVWMFGWDWTGFNGGYSQITTTNTNSGTTTTTAKPSGKTLWDLLQLLIIPLVLAGGGLWFNQVQKEREQRAADERTKAERDAAEQRAKTEREIVLDNQREAALQAYIDKMSELLLHEALRESSGVVEVRRIATLQTLTALPRLDGKRKGSVLLFLYEAGLIEKSSQIIMFGAAGLHRADLQGCDLSGFPMASLYGSYISYAILDGADFTGVHLRGICFEGCNLRKAKLIGADLRDSEFFRTDLSGVDLTGADLTNASFIAVNLTGAIVTDEQLDKASSLQVATMPNGSKHT